MSFQSSTCAPVLSLCSPGSSPFNFFDFLLGGEKICRNLVVWSANNFTRRHPVINWQLLGEVENQGLWRRHSLHWTNRGWQSCNYYWRWEDQKDKKNKNNRLFYWKSTRIVSVGWLEYWEHQAVQFPEEVLSENRQGSWQELWGRTRTHGKIAHGFLPDNGQNKGPAGWLETRRCWWWC